MGSFASNAWGLHDMHGNVQEWVEDCWNDSYAGSPQDGSAWRSGDCSERVLRGGSWYSDPSRLRAGRRVRDPSDFRHSVSFMEHIAGRCRESTQKLPCGSSQRRAALVARSTSR